MTTTTTAGSDDTTMDDASSTSVERQDKHPSSNPKEITLKFVFKLKKTENIDVATLHRNLLMNIQRIDQNAKFFDQQGNGFNPLKANDFSSKYTYEKFPRQHFLLVCVAHKLCLNHSLNNLKRDMRNALVTNRASITIHTWSTLDTRDVGWLLHTHPRFHNRKDIHTKLSKTLTKINTDKQIPEFRLYVKTIVDNKQDNQRVSAQVITIECESCNVHRLRELLHTAYSSISQSLPGKFIPTNYQHIESKEKYSSLICLQSQYLQDHRNISISGVTLDDLDTKIAYNNTTNTIHHHIHSFKQITWISPIASTTSTPRTWNISTTSTEYLPTCQFLRSTILENITDSTSSIPYVDLPTTTHTQLSSTTKSYLAALNQHIPSHTSHTYTPSATTPTRNSTTTTTSSLTQSASRPNDVQFENLKLHVAKTVSNLQQEFRTLQKDIQQSLQNQIKALADKLPLQNSYASYTSKNSSEQIPLQMDLHQSFLSLKNDFQHFRNSIKKELENQLQTTVSEVVRETTNTLKSLITTEVHHALRTHLNTLTPRHRKTKRNRMNESSSDSLSQRLFADHDNTLSGAPGSKNSRTDAFEVSNEIFEANMTVHPDSPLATSDAEESTTNQLP